MKKLMAVVALALFASVPVLFFLNPFTAIVAMAIAFPLLVAANTGDIE